MKNFIIMKKLSEIKLNDFYEMDEMEMRNIIGGSSSDLTCSYTCGGEEKTITCPKPGCTSVTTDDGVVYGLRCTHQEATRILCFDGSGSGSGGGSGSGSGGGSGSGSGGGSGSGFF